MNEQSLTGETNRRDVLKLSGMGMLAGVAGSALTPGKAHAAVEDIDVVYASWIHGNSMEIEYPERIASQEHLGYYFKVEGNPGTANWFHFAIPTPVIVNDVRLRIKKVALRFTPPPWMPLCGTCTSTTGRRESPSSMTSISRGTTGSRTSSCRNGRRCAGASESPSASALASR